MKTGRHLFREFERQASARPSDIYLVAEGRAVTFSQFIGGVQRRSSEILRTVRSAAAPVIGFVADDSLATAETIWAAIGSNARVALFDPAEPKQAIADSMQTISDRPLLYTVDSDGTGEFKGLATSPPNSKDADAAGASLAPGFMFRTSGTEGEPTWVSCNFDMIAAAIAGMLDENCLTHARNKHVLITPPLAHSYGLSAFLEYSIAGSSIRLPSTRSALGPMLELSVTDPIPVSSIEGVPYFYEQLVRMSRRFDMTSLQHVGIGGGGISESIRNWVISDLPNVTASIRYGMTETPSVVSQNLITSPANDDWEHSGVPLSIFDLKVVNESGSLCSVGETGEIVVRGESVAVTNEVDSAGAGWLRTGDLGWLDNRRQLHIVGRKSAFIKRRGYRFSPEDVEGLLNAHPAVSDSLVRQDAENLVADVVPTEEYVNAAQLLRDLSGVIPDYAIPDSVTLVNTIPRTKSGKIKR